MINEANLLEDLSASSVIKEKVKDNKYAQNLYAAICQNEFQKIDVWNILNDNKFQTSWRAAGRFIADLRGINETYMDFYCSGISDDQPTKSTVESVDQKPEGYISVEIMKDLEDLGWRPINYDPEEYINWNI